MRSVLLQFAIVEFHCNEFSYIGPANIIVRTIAYAKDRTSLLGGLGPISEHYIYI